MTLEEERKALEEQRRTLEREKKEFARRVENEDRRLEQQQKLFDMKFKILEEELVKLATEKEHVKKQKAFYQRVSDFSVTAEQPVIRGETVCFIMSHKLDRVSINPVTRVTT